jgi:hypothetical protein
MKASNVRKARQFLRKHAKAGTRDISPQKFAAAAAEQNASFSELLGFIGRMFAAGQGESFQRQENIRAIAQRGTK